MHIPDGFIGPGTSAVTGAVAVGAIAVCVRRAGIDLDEKRAPLAGLAAAFIFAVQMLNFPVAAGTSGHLLGGVLAAVLVGPWAGALCVSVVLIVQALMFADGGLSALGLNIMNMAVIGALVGYALFAVIRGVLPRNRRSVVLAAGLAAGVAPNLGALGFVVEYSFGGNGAAPLGTVLAAMLGVHSLIGIGEGLITAMAVSSVLAVRPDLVHGASHLTVEPVVVRESVGV